MSQNQREVIAYLSDPRHYPGRPRGVDVIETHFAWVFLAAGKAYKLKKPTRQVSMDYRTVEARERGCRNELRLNRRLAPRIYRRVVPIVRSATGGLALGRGPRVLDWLVEMRRLPAARMLDRAIREGKVRLSDVRRVVRRLVRFFRHARSWPLPDSAYRARLRRQISESARDLAAPDLKLRRRSFEPVIRAQLEFLVAGAEVLAGRGARLVEGHGDLRPEHVYLGTRGSAACVIDCLEFEANLRRLDPAEEIAFLALECERSGARELARDLIAAYRSTARDAAASALIHFYMSRRAVTRAKIAAWHLRDEQFAGEHRLWRAHAYSYLRDALRHIRSAQRALPLRLLEQLRHQREQLVGSQRLAGDAQVRVRLQALHGE